MHEFQQHSIKHRKALTHRPHLLFVNDVYPGFNVRESMGCRQDGFALELLVQLPVSPAVQREGRAVHETPQVVVLVEVSYPVLHLVRVEVRLHVGYLNVGLRDGTGCAQ